jgi:hypothetical protein
MIAFYTTCPYLPPEEKRTSGISLNQYILFTGIAEWYTVSIILVMSLFPAQWL